jgi:hypothetical protein
MPVSPMRGGQHNPLTRGGGSANDCMAIAVVTANLVDGVTPV